MQQRYLRTYDSLRCFMTSSKFFSDTLFQPWMIRSLKNSQCLNIGLNRAFAASITISAENKHIEATSSADSGGLEAQGSKLDDAIAQEKEKQTRAPWHREGSNIPPVRRHRSAGAMTKGKRFSISYL